MKQMTRKAEGGKAWNRTLAVLVPYSWDWTEYEEGDTLPALDPEDHRKMLNNQAEAKARSAAWKKALDGMYDKPSDANPALEKFDSFVESLMTVKDGEGNDVYTLESARALTQTALHLDYSALIAEQEKLASQPLQPKPV